MAELKFGFWLFQVTGLAAFIWSFFININDFKSALLFTVGFAFGVIKVYSGILDVQKKRFDNKSYYRKMKREWELENIKMQKELKDASDDK